MDPIVSVLLFIVGAIIGAGIVWAVLKKAVGTAQERGRSEGETEKALLSQSLESVQTELTQVRGELQAKSADVSRLAGDLRESETRREDERKAAEEKLAVLDQAEKQLRDVFKALSADALRNNNESFLELAKASLKISRRVRRGTWISARSPSTSSLIRCASPWKK